MTSLHGEYSVKCLVMQLFLTPEMHTQLCADHYEIQCKNLNYY